MFRRLIVFTFITIMVALIAGAAGVAADEHEPASLSITPVDAPDSYFTLELEPGDTEVLTVRLGNEGGTAADAHSYTADVVSLVNGGAEFLTADDPATGTTTWVEYELDTFHLGAGESIDHTFTVTVPDDTPPGDYITGLVIQPVDARPSADDSSTDDMQFSQMSRQAIAIAIDVPGERNPALAVDGVRHEMHGVRSAVYFDVQNAGNQHLRPVAELRVEDASGEPVAEHTVTMGSLYAHRTAEVTLMLEGRLEPGDYAGSITVTDEETGVSASSERIPFRVEAPPEPASDPASDDGAGVAGTVTDTVRQQTIDRAGNLNWLVILALGTIVVLLLLLVLTLVRGDATRGTGNDMAQRATPAPAATSPPRRAIRQLTPPPRRMEYRQAMTTVRTP